MLIRFVLVGLSGLLFGLAPFSARAQVIELRQAQADLFLDGQRQSAQVSLPYGWDYHHVGKSGVGRFTMQFDGPTAVSLPWVIFFNNLGNAYEVWLNGELIEQNGELNEFNRSDFAKLPRLINLPKGYLQPKNQLVVAIRSDVGRRSGVPVILLGPVDEVKNRVQLYVDWRLNSSLVVIVFSLLVASFAMVLWVTQTDPRPQQGKKRDRLYLFAAIAEFSWALYVGDTFVASPPLTWVAWAIATNLALGLWLSAMLLFIHDVAGWSGARFSRSLSTTLIGLLLIEPLVVYLAISTGRLWLNSIWLACFALLFLPSTVFFFIKALRVNNFLNWLIVLAFVINVPVGLRDLYALRIADSFGNHGLLRYSAFLFGLTLAAIVIDRFRQANMQVRELMENLTSRISQKEQELSQTYERMEVIAREQERTAERTRILRDMHDGVGSHISAAIRQLQSGRANDEQLMQTLRESLDQLKLSIDAMSLPSGDITALLASLRYRLEPRLKASDIELQWDVDLVEPLARVDDKAMRHLQFMVFEALSNVLQHAKASVLRIELRGRNGGGAALRLIDNGSGFDLQTVKPQGLGSLRERALAIGAKLTVSSAPGQTMVEILLD
jgi:signal transduction histidine kinase